jgi:hypothetical protein
MIPGRLRECLKILRWKPADLAEELQCPPGEIAAWMDGRACPPLAVAAWIEALTKAHKALPAPGRGIPPLPPGSRAIDRAEMRLGPPMGNRAAMSRLPAASPSRRMTGISDACTGKPAPPVVLSGGYRHESHTF